MFVELVLTGMLAMGLTDMSNHQDIGELIQALTQGEKDCDAYMSAVKRLVALEKRAVPPLIDALASKDEELRSQAAVVLGQIGNAAAIPSLAKLVKQGGRLGVEALRAVCHIGGPEAATVIMVALA